eukprot:9910598-Heterocapsa_arctica.AAC.1
MGNVNHLAFLWDRVIFRLVSLSSACHIDSLTAQSVDNFLAKMRADDRDQELLTEETSAFSATLEPSLCKTVFECKSASIRPSPPAVVAPV